MASYLSRFHPDDFRMRSRFGAYEELVDWPYTYEELEPYYSRAEWEIGVSGDGRGDPSAGFRSKAYPMPPLDPHPLAERLDEACRKLGLASFPAPRGVNSQPYQGRPACAFCTFCGGHGCPVGARGTVQEALLPRAVESGHCEVRSRAMARKITVDAEGKATGCVYLDEEGREHRIEARVVCVCCSAVESARLLLLSPSPLFPQGLANGSGIVGRHLHFHSTSIGQARFRIEKHGSLPFADPHPIGRSASDFYFLPDGVSDLRKGGLLIFDRVGQSPVLAAKMLSQLDSDDGMAVWGPELKRRLKEFYSDLQILGFEVQHDFIPNEGTWTALDPEVCDNWGLPVARIHLSAPPHHAAAGRWLVDRGLEALEAMGADELWPMIAGETAPYLVHGTCRAGKDPRTSVLNEYCQAHEVPNLFVVDGSFMPTSGGAPPTLTILANSFRTADHILARSRRGELG